MSDTTCPLPTPELASALANQFIERRQGCAELVALRRAFTEIIGPLNEEDPRCRMLLDAALELASKLDFPAPYETVVNTPGGNSWPAERHTITYFTDGEGFEEKDWAAIAALAVGESYLVAGQSHTMTVTRKE